MKNIDKTRRDTYEKIRVTIILGFILVMMFALTGCGKKTIKLDKYISISTDGYDSVGTAYCEFDRESFLADYEGKIKLKKANDEIRMMSVFYGNDMTGLFLDTCINYQLDKYSGLSNGDVVTLSWNCEDLVVENCFNVKLEHSDISFPVNNLKEVGEFNPFDFVKVSFSGMDSEGRVEIAVDRSRSEMDYIVFTASRDGNLKSGEKVTLSASISGYQESFIEKFGCVLGQTEETYTVGTLAHYVSDFAEIPDNLYKKMDKQLRDYFDAHVARCWVEGFEPVEFKLYGNYLLNLKPDMWGYDNYLYYIYEVTIPTEDDELFTYYWYGYFTDIMILEDGTCTVNIGDYVVSESDDYGYGLHTGDYLKSDAHHYVAGFGDIDSLFNAHVTAKIASYTYQQQIK